MVEDGDEYCSDDTPEIPPPPTTRPSFWELSERDQALAYAAYLRYLQNPEYYQRLYLEYLNDNTMPMSEDLAHLATWVQYAEDPAFLDMFLGFDLEANLFAEVEEAQEAYLNGMISREDWWAVVGTAFFVLGTLEIRSGSGKLETGIRPNQMNQQIKRGRAPRGVLRVDRGVPETYEQPHVHFEDGSALNVDGTWKHGGTTLSRKQESWLLKNGWSLPK